jgi:hypothetical protein
LRLRHSIPVAGLIVAAASAGPLRAQDTLGEPVPCSGQLVSDIVIRTEPPALGEMGRRSRLVAQLVRSLHATTQAQVVRRLIIQGVGAPCRELARAESERILRAQPFIAEATITPHATADGSVVLEVVTVDELEWVVDLGARGRAPYVNRFGLGNSNIAGEAIALRGGWQAANGPYRDTYGARFADYQLLGRPYQLLLAGTRRPLGGDWIALAGHAFLTDLQRVAWRAATGERSEYVALLRETADAPSIRVQR